MYAAIAFLRSPTAFRIGLGIALTVGAWSAYLAVDHSGYSRGVRDAEDAAQLVAYAAAEEAHQYTLAEIERGDELSKQLLETQAKLRSTEREYLTYAHAITGNCNSDDFRVFVQHASGNTAAAVPKAPSPPVDGPAAQSAIDLAYEEALARIIAENIGTNLTRLDLCIAEKRALNEFHTKPKSDLK